MAKFKNILSKVVELVLFASALTFFALQISDVAQKVIKIN